MGEARIGIIGAGYWATYFYLPFLAAHPEARCVGVVRRDASALAALRRSFDLEIATDDVAELLARGCDGVIVASPHSLHVQHARQALEAGCHVLVEKPMTLRLAEARQLSKEARRVGRLVTVACGWNYSPLGVWAMSLVQSGRLGAVRAVSGSMASALQDLYSGLRGYGTLKLSGHQFEASSETYTRTDAGGGYLYGQLSHQLGLALALIGSDPEEVFATFARLENGVDIDDALVVRFEDGTVGSFSGSGRLPWGVRYPLNIQLVAEGGILSLDFGRDLAEAYFSRSDDREVYRLDEGAEAFTGRGPDEVLQARLGDGLYSCEGPAKLLIDRCLNRSTVDRAPVELGVRAVAVLEAAYCSATIGAPVRVGSL
jgi:predicted dehydrogenase